MLYTTPQFAELLHISPRTLERWRIEGYGPSYVKAGRRVLYKKDDVEIWLTEGERRSTSHVTGGGAS